MKDCKAVYQEPGEMQCPRCGLTWDVDDPDRPECLTDDQLGLAKIKEIVRDCDDCECDILGSECSWCEVEL